MKNQIDDLFLHQAQELAPKEGRALVATVQRYLTYQTNWEQFSAAVDHFMRSHPWLVDGLSRR